jgi:hypothetical protein
MIILDEREFLEKELNQRGFEIFDFFQDRRVLSMESFVALDLKRRNEIVLVDTETILSHPQLQEQFKTLLNTFIGVIFFHEHKNSPGQNWVKNESSYLKKIIGEYCLPMPELSWNILSNQMQFFWTLIEDQKNLQKHLAQFSYELENVLQNAEEEMQKAKKIHDTLIPKRNEEIKGIAFSYKYLAGDGGGGEFYDLIQSNSKIFHIIFSGQSYLLSSAVMALLSTQKEKKFRPETFIKDVSQEAETINNSKKKKSEFDLLVTEIDPVTLTLKVHTQSNADLYSYSHGRLKLQKGDSYQLIKGEKLIVFSSGFIFNWGEGHPKDDLYDLLKKEEHLSSGELMSELFFQLKEGKEGQFLKKDATMLLMEVNRHGIHKV